jgi:beta-glucosidase
MTIEFPRSFIFGTSTSAYQIETGLNHDWIGVKSRDGHTFGRTTDHESRMLEDVDIIASVAPWYRMSLQWSKLQRSPYAALDPVAKEEYHVLFRELQTKGVNVMMVLFHWANPLWFNDRGGWCSRESVPMFLDYATKVIEEFGKYVSYWNTLNEPNLYATLGFLAGEFPPYGKNLFKALDVTRNLSTVHQSLYTDLHNNYPQAPVGISLNCATFAHENSVGRGISKLADYWYLEYLPSFFEASDFTGVSYYARLSFDPRPLTALDHSRLLRRKGRHHDDIWEYYPDGLAENVRRFSTRYKKPVIITENGYCSANDEERIAAIKDYMVVLDGLLKDGIDIRGYFHWSTWDNFEWNLGPTYRFGLYSCDPITAERRKKPSADVYAKLAYDKVIEV